MLDLLQPGTKAADINTMVKRYQVGRWIALGWVGIFMGTIFDVSN
jgi:hypothetical protein